MRVLVIGRSASQMTSLLVELHASGFDVLGSTGDGDVLRALVDYPFDVVAIGGTVEQESRERIIAACNGLDPAPTVLEIADTQLLMERLHELAAGR